MKALTEAVQTWQAALKRLQELSVLNNARTKLVDEEIPALQASIKKHEDEYPSITKKAEQVSMGRTLVVLVQV